MKKNKKTKKQQTVLTRKDMTKQPIGTALRGVVSDRMAGVVKVILNTKLEKAYNEMIVRHAKGEPFGQLSLFATDEVKEKYLGDNKLIFDIDMSELTTDPKRYQEVFNAVCQLAYVDVVVPVSTTKKDGEVEQTLLVTKMFNLLLRANMEETTDEHGNTIFKYKRGMKPVVGLAMEKVVAEYIYSLDKGYTDILPFPVIMSSSKYYPNFYSYLCDFKRNDPCEVVASYDEIRKLAGLGTIEEDTRKGEEEIVEEAMEARRKAEQDGTPELAPTDEQIEEMKRNNSRYYIVFSQFFKRIIKPVMEEMKENAEDNISDIWFEVEKIYTHGRAKNPDKLKFIIHLSELGKELQTEREATKEVIALEKRLRNEFKQTNQQVKKIMKDSFKFRGELTRKMNELRAAREAGKIKIDSDEGAYWNVALTNFIEKKRQQMEGEQLQFTEAEVVSDATPAQQAQPAPKADTLEERWGRVMAQFRPLITVPEWRQMFDHSTAIRPLSFEDGKLILGIPDIGYYNYFVEKYWSLMQPCIVAEFGEVEIGFDYLRK